MAGSHISPLALESLPDVRRDRSAGQRIVARMLVGLSTRRYEVGLEPVRAGERSGVLSDTPPAADCRGICRCAVKNAHRRQCGECNGVDA
jgi:hypothetical protein